MAKFILMKGTVDEDDACMEHIESFDDIEVAIATLQRVAAAYGKEVGVRAEGYGGNLIMVGYADERAVFEVFTV